MRSLVLSLGAIALMGCPQSTIDPVGSDGLCNHSNRTFNGDVVIPRDADCTFDDVRINGFLEMRPGSFLEANDMTVEEHVLAEDTLAVIIIDSDIEQRVELLGGEYVELQGNDIDGLVRITGQSDEVWVINNDIQGDTRILDNTAVVEILDNDIDGSLTVDGNTGGVFIHDNDIDGTLACADNDPAPQFSDNDVGNREGQCGPVL